MSEELDYAVALWHGGAFPDETPEQLGLCIGEECGELLRAILKESHGANDRRAYVDWRAEQRNEIGDVLIGLAALAMRRGWHLDDILRERLDFVRSRFPAAVSDIKGEQQ